MGGFSDNYECGYWGDEAPPMSKRQEKNFTRNKKIFEEDKIDNTKVVNDFCFFADELKDIQVFWDDENFYLKQTKA